MTTPTFTFTMGLPGAGKSTIIAEKHSDATVIDPDAIKAAHKDYDPKNPAALHVWSKDSAEAAFAHALTMRGEWLLDGTGTNVEVLVKNIRRAAAAGFKTRLLFVAVSLETAITRNATRTRSVPEQIIREKAETIWTAFEIAAKQVDDVDMVWND